MTRFCVVLYGVGTPAEKAAATSEVASRPSGAFGVGVN